MRALDGVTKVLEALSKSGRDLRRAVKPPFCVGLPPATFIQVELGKPSSLTASRSVSAARHFPTALLGEALASFYAHGRGLRSIPIRRGAFGGESKVAGSDDRRMLALWRSEADLSQLTHRAIEAIQEIRYLVVNGSSGNQFKRTDISDLRKQLGSSPQHSSCRITGNCTLQSRRPDEPEV